MKRIVLFITLLVTSMFFLAYISPEARAAAPDGAGPWADSVVSFTQGLMKNGGAVPAIRSDATAALGVAEDTTADGVFVSLGFGGTLTLQFDNPISNGIIVVEATNIGYPIEHATVSLSADGVTWNDAGTVSQDGVVDMPPEAGCAQYVRITDTSNPADFTDDTADAYDVDGVQATEGQSCTIPSPTPTSTPIITPTPTDIPSVTPTPTSVPETDPTVTPTPTSAPSNPGNGPTGDGKSDGRSDGLSSCPSCTAPPPPPPGGSSGGSVLGASTEGQVLGASTDTLAATGSLQYDMRIAFAIGLSILCFSLIYSVRPARS